MKNKITRKNKSHKAVKSSSKIKTSMTFAELLRYPEAIEVLMEKGFHCIGCPSSTYETISQGAVMHGINPDELVAEINNKLSKTKSKPKKNKIKSKKKKL